MNWQPGDRAILLWSNYHPDRVGKEVTVLSNLKGAEVGIQCAGRRVQNGTPVYRIDIRPNTIGKKYVVVTPNQLGPIYDGNETVSWESCIWQPSPVVTVPMLKEQAE